MDRLVRKLMAWLKLRPLAHTPKSVLAVVVLIICIMLAIAATTLARRTDKTPEADLSEQSRRVGDLYYPTPQQWAALTTAPVTELV